MAPSMCPNCGAFIEDDDAVACPECGADENTGWSDHATEQRLDLPDANFDYDEFIENEFGTQNNNRVKTEGVPWWVWAVAVGILLLLLLGRIL